MRIIYFLLVLITSVSITSCSHKHDHENDHSHDEILSLTTYNEYFEVFVEADPFVTGEESSLIAHITKLDNFKPLDSAEVTATLTVGSNKIEHIAPSATSEGEFHFNLTPNTIGKGELSFNISTNEGASVATIDDITIYDNEHTAHEEAHDAIPEVVNGIAFTKGQSWKVGFATEVVRRQEFGQVIKTTAQIQPSSGDERIITAMTDGVVIFQDNQTVPGRAVSSGQRLFYIDASEMADNNLSVKTLEAESEYNRAKIEYERKEKLAKDNIISQSELLQAKTELANAQANVDNLNRNFTSGKQAVSSPLSGFVTDVLVQNGEFVSAGQPVLRVSKNKDLFIKAELQPKYFNTLSNISTANITIPAINQSYSLEELNGKVLSYGQSSNMNNPLIPVMFQVSNSAGLLPGSFVDMYIKIKSNNQEISIPNTAIVEEMGAYFVMVQITPELFEKRAIVKGPTDGFSTLIVDGVSENERIVSKGAIFVKLAQAAGALDPHAGHAH